MTNLKVEEAKERVGFTMPVKVIDPENENEDLDESSEECETVQSEASKSSSSLKREFDRLQASFTSLPESEQRSGENMHETQGRIILKNGKRVRPKEHVVMEFFEMC